MSSGNGRASTTRLPQSFIFREALQPPVANLINP
jgi:hypothetical protein